MLLREIFDLVLTSVAGLLGISLLLRMYLAWLRISRSNPLSTFCIGLTDWLVRPLRNVMPNQGRFDAASLLAAILVALLVAVLEQLVYLSGFGNWAMIVPAALGHLGRWTLWLLFFLVLLNAVLSLVNPHAPLAPTFDILTRPLLAPLRRMIPLVGGIDLTPWVLLILIQIGLMVLSQLRF